MEYFIRTNDDRTEICHSAVFPPLEPDAPPKQLILAWADRGGRLFCQNADVAFACPLDELPHC